MSNDSQSQVHTSCCIHTPMLHSPRYLVTPHGFPVTLGKREFFLQGCCISIFTLYSMHETAISSVGSSYCYISTAGKQGSGSFSLDYRVLSHNHSLFPLSLSPLPPTLTPSHTYIVPRGILFSLLCLLLAKYTLYIPLNTNLLPSPQNSQNSPEGSGFSITNVRKTSRLFLNSALCCLP